MVFLLLMRSETKYSITERYEVDQWRLLSALSTSHDYELKFLCYRPILHVIKLLSTLSEANSTLPKTLAWYQKQATPFCSS